MTSSMAIDAHFHLWQVGNRQRAVGDDAEEGNRRHQQAGPDWPPDKDFRRIHAVTPYGCPGAGPDLA